MTERDGPRYDPHGARLVYAQIADDIAGKIARGVYTERIPSLDGIVQEYGCARMTARRAVPAAGPGPGRDRPGERLVRHQPLTRFPPASARGDPVTETVHIMRFACDSDRHGVDGSTSEHGMLRPLLCCRWDANGVRDARDRRR